MRHCRPPARRSPTDARRGRRPRCRLCAAITYWCAVKLALVVRLEHPVGERVRCRERRSTAALRRAERRRTESVRLGPRDVARLLSKPSILPPSCWPRSRRSDGSRSKPCERHRLERDRAAVRRLAGCERCRRRGSLGTSCRRLRFSCTITTTCLITSARASALPERGRGRDGPAVPPPPPHAASKMKRTSADNRRNVAPYCGFRPLSPPF